MATAHATWPATITQEPDGSMDAASYLATLYDDDSGDVVATKPTALDVLEADFQISDGVTYFIGVSALDVNGNKAGEESQSVPFTSEPVTVDMTRPGDVTVTVMP